MKTKILLSLLLLLCIGSAYANVQRENVVKTVYDGNLSIIEIINYINKKEISCPQDSILKECDILNDLNLELKSFDENFECHEDKEFLYLNYECANKNERTRNLLVGLYDFYRNQEVVNLLLKMR